MCWNHHEETKSKKTKKGEIGRRKFVETLSASALLTAGGVACATNAETGKRQFLLVGEGELAQMSARTWTDIKSKQALYKNVQYNQRLENIGARIAKGANRGAQKWEYAVFDSEQKNAFVLPGNKVGFYKGIMDFADNDDQIAAIMGHEVGHVSGRHAQERVSQQMAGNAGIGLLSIFAQSQLSKNCKTDANKRTCNARASRNTQLIAAGLGAGLTYGVILPYSRAHESQSDLLGAKYMHHAGYDPYQSVKLWEKMAANTPSRQPAFLSTHPDPANRARDLHAYIRHQEGLGSQGWQTLATS